jgi:hypothetical protein
VCISSDAAVVAADTVIDAAAAPAAAGVTVDSQRPRQHRLLSFFRRRGSASSPASTVPTVDVEAVDRASRCRRSVWTLLQDDRMLAHDDGEGRPLRYMSLYGGIVTKLL